jgi:putative nucleotidyltransferase with HDIG domain
MNNKTFTGLMHWFNEYTSGFRSPDLEVDAAVRIKIGHTRRVCRIMKDLAVHAGLDGGRRNLAGACALFHDIGRFEQYRRHRTFVDRKSEDHARLGAGVLKKHGVLQGMIPGEKDLLLTTVRNHNRLALLPGLSEEQQLFCRLVRDADKLDILDTLTRHYARRHRSGGQAMELDLPDTPGFTGPIHRDILKGRAPVMRQMRNLNDFKLVQMAWVFDLNFPRSRQAVLEGGYLEKIRRSLPEDPVAEAMYRCASRFLRARDRRNP